MQVKTKLQRLPIRKRVTIRGHVQRTGGVEVKYCIERFPVTHELPPDCVLPLT
jgi:hypothetical protein